MTKLPAVFRTPDVLVAYFNGSVKFKEEGDDTICKCCADECEVEMDFSVSFCGMTASGTCPIPGFAGANDALQDGSFIIAFADVICGPCGWFVSISICAFCVATNQFASEAFTAEVPFAANAEPGGGYCPESGQVNLICFGDQFGIPCITNTTATIG